MQPIEVKSERRRRRGAELLRSQRLRPTVMALEARTLLSTFTVDSTADDGSAGTLRWAISQANGSQGADTIDFSALFNTPQTIALTSGPLGSTDTATTTISGPGANLLTISGNSASRVFDITGSAALSGLTVTGGNADMGAGLLNDSGTLTLTDVAISGNSATAQGGGLETRFGGTTTLSGCTVSGNTAPDGAGVYSKSGTLSLTNCTVSGNTATAQGGGLLNSAGAATLINCTVSANSATTGGGVSSSGAGATLALSNTIVAGQISGGDVDGSFTGGTTSNLIGVAPKLAALGDYGGPTFTMALLPGSPATGNGSSGNGVPATDQRGFARGGSVDIGSFQSQSKLVVNTAFGGTGSATGQLSLAQAVNLANALPTADTITFSPAAFATSSTITLTGGQLSLTDTATTTITGPGANLLTVSGTGASRVFDVSGSAALSGLTISGGKAGAGGGLYDDGGTTTLTGCTVSGNTATTGGGIASHGTLTLYGVTVSDNTATTGGGVASTGGTLSLVNATVSGNTARGQGGGLYVKNDVATLTSATISANAAVTGGGLINSGSTATLTLKNTIVAGQSSGGDVTGLYFDHGNNVVGVDPGLTALGDYGGPTMTMAPLPGSPAIGRGAAGAGVPTTDQRGFARGASVDVGAFQTQAALVVNVLSDGVGAGLGELSLRQGTDLANLEPGTNTITFDSSLFGAGPRTMTLTGGEISLGAAGTTVVTGPGANLLTIDGHGASRVFIVNGAGAALSGLTITGGNAPMGGGVANYNGTLSLTGCIVTGNSAAQNGGGLYSKLGSNTLTNCTVSDNSASDGGGLYSNQGVVSLTNCTLSDNSATDGGGLFSNQSGMSLTNCTVSGNSVTHEGGGLFEIGPLGLTNCTVSGNNADFFAGGLYGSLAADYAPVALNTIIAGNQSPVGGGSGADIGGHYPINNHSLIGGTPLLSALGDYGGQTPTMALLPGSPAIGGGTRMGAPDFDQRNQPRIGGVDIGAFQSQGFTVKVVAASTPQSAVVGTAFANPLAVTVTPNNPGEPVDGGVIDFVVTPGGGASATISAATATIAGGMASVTATANATIGPYIVSTTVSGAEPVGFVLTNTEAPSLTVTTRSDVVDATDGLTSLREAIAYANSHPGPDTITIDPAAFGKSHRTIVLTAGPLILTDPATTTIIGPGARRLTLSGGGKSQVLDIQGGSLALSGVTIADGRADLGGGLRNDGGKLSLTKVTIRGNRALIGGALFNTGSAVLTDVVIRGNKAVVGSGMFSARRATLTLRRSPAGAPMRSNSRLVEG